ncbi:MAG: queuosine precursor transporter [Legionella sp.]|nr:queuosine precursor transporter [Legionella sp.]
MITDAQQIELSQSDIKGSVVLIGILFSAFLILSNLAAVKLTIVGQITFPAGLIFFPITYIFDNILTEVYGFKISRRIIWSALAANLIVSIGTWIITYLPPSPYWEHQLAYETIYRTAPRVFIASMISYFFGEFANSILLAKLKIITKGRYLWIRALVSTVIGVGIDTIIFIHIAFLFILPYEGLWKVILSTYLLKVAYEMGAIPITYKVSNYLKKKDKIDFYDYHTKFNPFSLEI